MKRKSFSVLFFIRKSRLLKNEEAPIYIRITVDGDRIDSSIKRSVLPKNWNASKGTVKPCTENYKGSNHYLEHLRQKVYEAQKDLEDNNKPVTALNLRNMVFGVEEDNNRTLLDLYDEHNLMLKESVDKGIAPLTLVRHITSRNHLAKFIKLVYRKEDFYIADIKPEFIEKYQHYLRTVRNCNHNTALKYIKNLGKIIRSAINNDLIRGNPFRNFRIKLEKVEKEFLTRVELEAIMNKQLEIPRIQIVKDIFVFCCFTGLAYTDVKSLKFEDLSIDNQGRQWIKKQRQKTKQMSQIPLLPPAAQILHKYSMNIECRNKGVLLPVLSNQKMNAYLKEIADLCKIKKKLTTHCARHTFATTVTLSNRVSMESVSKMLGHASIDMTKHYARILDSQIMDEMNPLLDKYTLN